MNAMFHKSGDKQILERMLSDPFQLSDVTVLV